MTDNAEQVDPQGVEARLRALESLPIDEHVAIYDGLHRELQDQLAGTPAASDPPDGADGSASSADGPDAPDNSGGAPHRSF